MPEVKLHGSPLEKFFLRKSLLSVISFHAVFPCDRYLLLKTLFPCSIKLKFQ